jgi:hypothetical protein
MSQEQNQSNIPWPRTQQIWFRPAISELSKFIALMMEAVSPSQTSVNIYQTTWRYSSPREPQISPTKLNTTFICCRVPASTWFTAACNANTTNRTVGPMAVLVGAPHHPFSIYCCVVSCQQDLTTPATHDNTRKRWNRTTGICCCLLLQNIKTLHKARF